MRQLQWFHDSLVAAAGVLLSDSLAAGLSVPFFFSGVSVAVDDVECLALRLSVTYQPDPLKTIPTGCGTRWMGPPHSEQVVSGSSANF